MLDGLANSLEMAKLVVEGAGAVTLAALLYSHCQLAKGNSVCVLSGGESRCADHVAGGRKGDAE